MTIFINNSTSSKLPGVMSHCSACRILTGHTLRTKDSLTRKIDQRKKEIKKRKGCERKENVSGKQYVLCKKNNKIREEKTARRDFFAISRNERTIKEKGQREEIGKREKEGKSERRVS